MRGSTRAEHPWVSRGGVEARSRRSIISASIRPGASCLDVGASTGGFTEVLLARGARRVYAVDVGRGQLHARLRGHPAVVSLEADRHPRARSGAARRAAGSRRRSMSASSRSSWCCRRSIALLRRPAQLVALIKPQFEAGREHIGRTASCATRPCSARSATTSPAVHRALGWDVRGIVASPIEGGDGNREFLIGGRGVTERLDDRAPRPSRRRRRRHAERPVFVPYTLPGETVEVERRPAIRTAAICCGSRRRARNASRRSARISACAAAAQSQHWDFARYRAWKRGLVVKALRAGRPRRAGRRTDRRARRGAAARHVPCAAQRARRARGRLRGAIARIM